MVVGLFRDLRLSVIPDQELTLQQLPSPTPSDGLLVSVSSDRT